MLIRARLVLPIVEKPIDDGAIIVEAGKIAAVGRTRDLLPAHSGERMDLGEVVVFPGLVNSHCHLDYTNMAGAIPPPKNFPDWIKSILALKAEWSYSEFAASWVEGARQCIENGITTIGDIESVPELIEEAWADTPLRITSFLELTGVKSQSQPSVTLGEGLKVLDSLPKIGAKRVGLSPHAPYSTTAGLLRLVKQAADERRLRLAMHVAESEAEFEMFRHASGPLHHWLKSQRDTSDCGEVSPVTLLDNAGLLSDRMLAVHVNYLAPGDALRLARARAHVAHCPRSHEYFEHARFPLDELSSAGVPVSIGTDSLASVRVRGKQKPQLSLFAELAEFSRIHTGVRPQKRLEMITVRGARALGMEGEVGQISRNACADVICSPFDGRAAEAEEWSCHEQPEISGVMLGGEWLRAPAAH